MTSWVKRNQNQTYIEPENPLGHYQIYPYNTSNRGSSPVFTQAIAISTELELTQLKITFKS